MKKPLFIKLVFFTFFFICECGLLNAESKDTSKRKIGFFFRHFTARGTEVASYDYADFNETILGNESFIFYVDQTKIPIGSPDFPKSVREKFQNRFQNRFYECSDFEEVESLIAEKKIDVLYNQKCGHPDEHLSKVCKNAVHAVFTLDKHANTYASISEWLSQQRPELHVPFVPYIVRLENTSETLHQELNIPADAIVFGRHGGYKTFDLKFAQEAVVEMAQIDSACYFVFLNTEPFCQLPNVIFLPGTGDLLYKTKFINTCDAMIHARSEGETFGLACAEFSIRNKPVITWLGGDRAHIAMLGEKGFYYHDKKGLQDILLFFRKNIDQIRQSDWDAYSSRYNPQAVMEKFNAVFLEPCFVK